MRALHRSWATGTKGAVQVTVRAVGEEANRDVIHTSCRFALLPQPLAGPGGGGASQVHGAPLSSTAVQHKARKATWSCTPGCARASKTVTAKETRRIAASCSSHTK